MGSSGFCFPRPLRAEAFTLDGVRSAPDFQMKLIESGCGGLVLFQVIVCICQSLSLLTESDTQSREGRCMRLWYDKRLGCRDQEGEIHVYMSQALYFETLVVPRHLGRPCHPRRRRMIPLPRVHAHCILRVSWLGHSYNLSRLHTTTKTSRSATD